MTSVSVPILTWHPQHVSGNSYRDNDLRAVRDDLETIHAMGLRIVPVVRIVDALLAGDLDRLQGCVGLTLDDGSDFDVRDLPHPSWGVQRSFLNVLRDFQARHGHHAQPWLHATTFVIVSPEARAELDRTCMIGCRWWNHDWYPEAEATGLMAVESQGWDHNHPTLQRTATTAPRGAFEIQREDEANAEIARSCELLRELRGRAGDVMFAFPYGSASEFLLRDWLPREGPRRGIACAFGDEPAAVCADSNRWRIPRLCFRRDWQVEGELERLLRSLRVRTHHHPAGLAESAFRHAPKRGPLSWTDYLRTWEVHDASVVAGPLFKKGFNQEAPTYPRHFVLVYSPPPDSEDTTPRVVAYAHQRPFDEVYLGGGMVADAAAYRKMPKWLFEQVKAEGGLATIVSKGSISMLGDSPASFGHVGEPRARAADLRTGYEDTGVEHLMVYWRKALPLDQKQRLIAKVAAAGPF